MYPRIQQDGALAHDILHDCAHVRVRSIRTTYPRIQHDGEAMPPQLPPSVPLLPPFSAHENPAEMPILGVKPRCKAC